jgi:hypothetical protein
VRARLLPLELELFLGLQALNVFFVAQSFNFSVFVVCREYISLFFLFFGVLILIVVRFLLRTCKVLFNLVDVKSNLITDYPIWVVLFWVVLFWVVLFWVVLFWVVLFWVVLFWVVLFLVVLFLVVLFWVVLFWVVLLKRCFNLSFFSMTILLLFFDVWDLPNFILIQSFYPVL